MQIWIMDLEKYEKIFARESEKYLEELDNALIEVEKDRFNQGLWSNIHGKIHSIKGMARALSMEKISGLCHSMEAWCKRFQEGTHTATDEAVQCLFDGTEILRTLATQKEDISLSHHAKQYHRLTARFSKGPDEPGEGISVQDPVFNGDEQKSIYAPDRIGHVRVEYSLIEELLGYSQEIIHLEKRLPPMTPEHVSSGVKGWIDHYMSVLKGLHFRLTKLRLIPVADFAGLFRKTLRDLARSYDREVSLAVIGGALQVDIALMDRLREPFMHLLRNAIAHGIEPPAEREAAGKPREGKVVLEAERRGDSLVLKISDDGRGINRSAIMTYLKQQRSMSNEAISRMPEEEFLHTTLNLDFSSTDHADETAGRGVGMNVVARAIESLNGSMSIRSRESEATQFIFHLPLSLSLVYAVTFRVGPYTLSVPTAHVQSIKGVTSAQPAPVESSDGIRKLLAIEEGLQEASHIIELALPGASDCQSQALGRAELRNGSEASDPVFRLAVDAVMGNSPLMVMPVGELLAKAHYFAGVGIMENGGISILLDTEKVLWRSAPQSREK